MKVYDVVRRCLKKALFILASMVFYLVCVFVLRTYFGITSGRLFPQVREVFFNETQLRPMRQSHERNVALFLFAIIIIPLIADL